MNSSLLLAEKIFSAASRYLLFIYCITHLSDQDSMGFLNAITSVILVFVFSHLGTDNLIISKINDGLDCFKFYALRISIGVLAFLLIFFASYGKYPWVVVVLILFAVIGTAIPVLQLRTIASEFNRNTFVFRALPELIASFFRIFAVWKGIDIIYLLIILYFSSEIIFGILNLIFIFRYRLNKRSPISSFDRGDFFPILWSFLSVGLLFFFQKGDLFILSKINNSMTFDDRILIKSQQFFDMSGIFASALVPIMLRERSNTALIIKSISFGLPILFFCSIFSINIIGELSFFKNLISVENGGLIFSISFSLGFFVYFFMYILNLHYMQNYCFIFILMSLVVKLILFNCFLEEICSVNFYIICWQVCAFFIFSIGFLGLKFFEKKEI